MKNTSSFPGFWSGFSQGMYVDEMPSAKLVVSQIAPYAFGRISSGEGLPETTQGKGAAQDYMVALHLREIPAVQQFLGSKLVSQGTYPADCITMLSFEDAPRVFLSGPFDTLVVHVTQAALDEVAAFQRVPRADHFFWPRRPDPTVSHLGRALLGTLEAPNHASKFFLDHVLHALHCHLVCSHSRQSLAQLPVRGGLGALQRRRATEFLEAHLDGDVDLAQVAAVCDLSTSHFSRAFRHTYGIPPYRWLIERRLEKAIQLLTDTRLPIPDIAVRCGFTDQSGFNRSFKRKYGVPPGVWRRSNE